MDFLSALHKKVVIDYVFENNKYVMVDSCFISGESFNDKYIGLNAILEGRHVDDCVSSLRFTLKKNDNFLFYVKNGDSIILNSMDSISFDGLYEHYECVNSESTENLQFLDSAGESSSKNLLQHFGVSGDSGHSPSVFGVPKKMGCEKNGKK